MPTLIVQLPNPPRLGATEPEVAPPLPSEVVWRWVVSPDGQGVAQSGQSTAAQLPTPDRVVAVVPPQALAWHRVTLPKAPAARVRAALAGVLEESLLDDEADLHLALAPGAKAGEPAWVAVMDKAWLLTHIDTLEAAGATVERVVPAWAPDGRVAAHVGGAEGSDAHWLAWRDEHGAVCLPADDGSARTWLARQPDEPAVDWSAAPDSAATAATWSGATVASISSPEALLAASRWDGNLRQFDLLPRHRGSRVARESWRRFWHERAWRPVRIGLLALVGVQLLGLNLWAWQQRQALARQKAAMTSVLQASFPHVRAVIDAPAQMQKEIEVLRAAAGRPGDTDLEPLLHAADSAWPPARGAAESLRYEPGKLTVAASGWTPSETAGFAQRLRALGLGVDAAPGRLVLRRLAPGEAPLPAAAPGTTAGTGIGTGTARPPVGPGAVGHRPAAEESPDEQEEDPEADDAGQPAPVQQGASQ